MLASVKYVHATRTKAGDNTAAYTINPMSLNTHAMVEYLDSRIVSRTTSANWRQVCRGRRAMTTKKTAKANTRAVPNVDVDVDADAFATIVNRFTTDDGIAHARARTRLDVMRWVAFQRTPFGAATTRPLTVVHVVVVSPRIEAVRRASRHRETRVDDSLEDYHRDARRSRCGRRTRASRASSRMRSASTFTPLSRA
jgi:phosphoribosyl-AMP cyclohydrolase